MRVDVDISSYGELLEEISGVKGVSSLQTGGTPPWANLAPPADLEESASHHSPPITWGTPSGRWKGVRSTLLLPYDDVTKRRPAKTMKNYIFWKSTRIVHEHLGSLQSISNGPWTSPECSWDFLGNINFLPFAYFFYENVPVFQWIPAAHRNMWYTIGELIESNLGRSLW